MFVIEADEKPAKVKFEIGTQASISGQVMTLVSFDPERGIMRLKFRYKDMTVECLMHHVVGDKWFTDDYTFGTGITIENGVLYKQTEAPVVREIAVGRPFVLHVLKENEKPQRVDVRFMTFVYGFTYAEDVLSYSSTSGNAMANAVMFHDDYGRIYVMDQRYDWYRHENGWFKRVNIKSQAKLKYQI
ncbi:hypothetical protein [Aeromonas phage phiWae14]|nr:hypothetical protein [Aeromonas phage phiWae14]